MDILTVIITLCFGYAGTVIFGNLLNMPDAGAIIAIAFIGGRIVFLLKNNQSSEK